MGIWKYGSMEVLKNGNMEIWKGISRYYNEFYWILRDFEGFYVVLRDFKGFYRILRKFRGV